MSKTGTIIVSLIVGAGIGYGIAQLTQGPAPMGCQSHLIVVNPKSTNPNLGDFHICKPLHQVTWQSSDGSVIKVKWVSITPQGAPYPYSLNCENNTTATCNSGPLLGTAQVGSISVFKVWFTTGGMEFNGRIIIDR